jgi:DNA-directed RNA polymerase subunit RPC12/RpoP
LFMVFICRKCGHNLYVEETDELPKKLNGLNKRDCPNCGEEGFENWIWSGRKKSFPTKGVRVIKEGNK